MTGLRFRRVLPGKMPSNAGTGASSILLIIVVVCLTIFAALSLVQAHNDAALTEWTTASVEQFYDADTRAQRLLAAIDSVLAGGGDPSAVAGVTKTDEGLYAFSVETDDGHALNVAVSTDGGRCTVESYRYETVGEWNADGSDTLWQG